MSAATVAPAPPARSADRPAGRVTQPRVVNSEWIKFRTLRSTFWSLAIAVGLMIAFGMLISTVMANQWPTMRAARKADFNAITLPLRGYFFGQLAVGILGVMVVTGEYSTGMIRASLSAVPKRLPVLWAKIAVFGAVTFVVMTLTSLICFFGGQAVFSSQHIQTTFSAPNAMRVVFGTGLYLTVVGLLGIGFGTIIRSTAGGIAAVVGTMLVLPVVGEALNQTSWGPHITPYLPGNAGGALITVPAEPNSMAPWPGFALFLGYAVLSIAVGAYLLKRRDA